MKVLIRNWAVSILLLFSCLDIFVWYTVYRESPTNYVTVAFLNIGQGDAIYIESPYHNRILVDGGPNSSLLGEVSKFIPFYSRSIDTLIVTNPDADHYSGFLDILNSYKVNKVLEPGTISTTARYKDLEQEIKDKNIERIIARRGMVVHLGGGADLTILFPDKDVSKWVINDGSIVAKLTYGQDSVMFTGDAPNKTEEYVLKINGNMAGGIVSDILKEGHHGSRTSASESFISAVAPKYDVISAGCKNRYGHPHQETLDLLNKLKIPILTTCKEGTIVFRLDGTVVSKQ